jgi:hypothetical protein
MLSLEKWSRFPMNTFKREYSERDLRMVETHALRGKEIITEQRRRIARIEAEGGEATAARSTLAMMERMQQEITEHRNTIVEALGYSGPVEN